MTVLPDIKPTLNPNDWLNDHGDYLFRYAAGRVRDVVVAEDLLQETLLAAMTASESYEGRSAERTWLVGILRHKILDYFRKLAGTREFHISNSETDDELACFETSGAWSGHWREDQAPISWPVDAIRQLESQEFWETFNRCLSRLSPQMAAAFTLREIDGMTSEDICEILSVTPHNLWVLLHRARAKLRHFLEAELFRNRKPERESLRRPPIEPSEFQSKNNYSAVAR